MAAAWWLSSSAATMETISSGSGLPAMCRSMSMVERTMAVMCWWSIRRERRLSTPGRRDERHAAFQDVTYTAIEEVYIVGFDLGLSVSKADDADPVSARRGADLHHHCGQQQPEPGQRRGGDRYAATGGHLCGRHGRLHRNRRLAHRAALRTGGHNGRPGPHVGDQDPRRRRCRGLLARRLPHHLKHRRDFRRPVGPQPVRQHCPRMDLCPGSGRPAGRQNQQAGHPRTGRRGLYLHHSCGEPGALLRAQRAAHR